MKRAAWLGQGLVKTSNSALPQEYRSPYWTCVNYHSSESVKYASRIGPSWHDVSAGKCEGNHIWTLCICMTKASRVPLAFQRPQINYRYKCLMIEDNSSLPGKEERLERFLLILRALGSLGQPLDLQLLCSFQESRQLLLSYVHLRKICKSVKT